LTKTKKTMKKNEPEEPQLKEISFEDAVKRLLQTPPSQKSNKRQPKQSEKE